MCKRCATLEYHLSLCALTQEVAKLWASRAPAWDRFEAELKLRAAREAVSAAEHNLLEHRKSSSCTVLAA